MRWPPALRKSAAVACVLCCAASFGVAADGPSAGDVLARLKAGNQRFATNASAQMPIDQRRRFELVKGQAPFATVLSCADSRVPPELVFNTGLGDLFVIRAAGEVVDRSVLASTEYAAEHLHIGVLVVMGHAFCGAVTAAIDSKTSLGPNLDFLIHAIRPAVLQTADAPEGERLKAAILANVEVQVNALLDESEILRRLVDEGELTIFGAYYELASGHVTFTQPVSAPSGPRITSRSSSR